MNEARASIAARLQTDPELLDLLPLNAPFFDRELETSKVFSILPASKVYEGMEMPIVTLMAGDTSRIGYELTEDFFYVRCYNNIGKTYVDIDKVLARVKVLLHRHRFTFVASASIETLYETTGSEFTDEGYNLIFRESRYRLLRV